MVAMVKRFLFFFSLFFSCVLMAQDFSDQWKGYFSFISINDVVIGNNKLYAASENAIFSYDLSTHEIKKLTTVNGLSGEAISTLHYSEAYGLLMIGFENGLFQIVFDSDDVLSVVDILEKPTIPPDSKKINHFNEYEGLVYISTDYGISVYDLNNLEFGDTYYIGSLGSQIEVRQTTIFENYIYVACQNGNGLKKASLANPNLIDYQEWEQVIEGNFLAVQEFSGKLYAFRNNRDVFEISLSNVLTHLVQYTLPVLDVKLYDNLMIATTRDDTFIYNPDFILHTTINVGDTPSSRFTSGVATQSNIYIGTIDSGVLNTLFENLLDFNVIYPDGPLMNSPFSIQAGDNELWVTYGEYSRSYNPQALNQRGVSHLKNEEWMNIPYDSLLGARDLNKISINTNNSQQVFISSFNDGILEINNDMPTILYNQQNSGLESLVVPNNPNVISIRVSATKFDRQGLLWSATGRVDHPLKSYNPDTGQWQQFAFDDLISDPFNDERGYCDLEIDQSGNKWLGGYDLGLICVSSSGNIQKNMTTEELNITNNVVTTLALDKRNQLWIGTGKGLRVLYNVGGFLDNPNPEVHEIIIEEDGLGSELLYEQYVSDIEVDGSNNKWIGTYDTGLFYFTSNGKETIYHFTKDNSPLPSNNIIDVSIDTDNGVVYIATDKGLLSFYAGGSSTKDNLTNAFVYPNPVRPGFNITEEKVKIKDISDNVNIKITDIEGNLVAEAQSRTNLRYNGYNLEIDGGTAYWNGKNLANNTVASGVYLIMLTDLDTLETNVLKVMVVR